GIGFSTAYILRKDNIPETVSVPVLGAFVGFVMAHIRLTFIPSERARSNIATYVSDSIGVNAPKLFGSYDLIMLGTGLVFARVAFGVLRHYGVRRLLIGLGAIVVFSSGGSQVGLATGPLETLFEESLNLPTIYLLIMGGGAILMGAWMGSPRVIHSVSREYSELGIRRSISALVPAFLMSQTAIFLGLPISTNEAIISSLIGSGLVEGSAGVSPKKIGYTIGAWLFSLFSAGLVGYGLYSILAALLGIT
ncbi:MAG: inorganic phosphate transporter, partial [Halobacteria archaeon]|nr:inorganic phosphate transporter [Halobacteria archaeon]